MHPHSLWRRTYLIGWATVAAITSACDSKGACGAERTLQAEAEFLGFGSVSFNGLRLYGPSFDGQRVHFHFETDVIEQVCSNEHLKAQASVRTHIDPGSDPAVAPGFQVSAAVPYYPQFETPIPLPKACGNDGCEWSGSASVGLRQAYQGGRAPGQFYLYVDISWLSAVGNRVRDSTYFEEALLPHIEGKVEYKLFKAPAPASLILDP